MVLVERPGHVRGFALEAGRIKTVERLLAGVGGGAHWQHGVVRRPRAGRVVVRRELDEGSNAVGLKH